MNLSSIINERPGMQVKIVNLGFQLMDIEEGFLEVGFDGDPKGLKECDKAQSITIIKNLLWKDMAFGQEIITESEAKDRAEFIIEELPAEGMKYYTNGDWAKGVDNVNGRCPMINSFTFDAGVLCVHSRGCETTCYSVWFIDED